MPLTIRHAFVSHKIDEPDTSLLRPSNWNEDHIISGALDLPGTTGQFLYNDAGILTAAAGISTPDGNNLIATSFGAANWNLLTSGLVPTFQGIGTTNTVLRLILPTSSTGTAFITMYNTGDVNNAGRLRMYITGTGATPALTAVLQTGLLGTGSGVTTQNFGEDGGASTLTSINWQFHGVTTAILTPTLFTVPTIGTSVLTVATLPVSPQTGQRAFVSDSNAVSMTAGIGAIVAAGGSTGVPVIYDGTHWRIG